MARMSRGFQDFVLKENRRQKSGAKIGALVSSRQLDSRMSAMERKLAETKKANEKRAPYTLPSATKHILATMAKKGCKRCRGEGIAGWKAHGTQAVICKCIEVNAPKLEETLKEQAVRLQKQIDEAKAAPIQDVPKTEVKGTLTETQLDAKIEELRAQLPPEVRAEADKAMGYAPPMKKEEIEEHRAQAESLPKTPSWLNGLGTKGE